MQNLKGVRMKKKEYLIKGIMVTFLALFLVGLPLQDSWAKAKQIKLNLATWGPPKGTVAKAIQWYADEVEKRTDGRVKVKIFWAGSLAKVKELPHAVRTGTADMAALIAVYHPELFQSLGASMECVILWGGDTGGQTIEAYRKLREEFPQVRDEFKKQNQKPLAFWEYDRMEIISTKPIKTLADAKGMKIRAVGTVLPKIFKAAGFIPITMPSSEAYDAANRGVVDSIIASLETAYKFKWYEKCKHWTRIGLLGALVGYTITINLDTWNKLPSDVKDIMDLAGRELTIKYYSWLMEENKKQEKLFRDNGVKFYDFSLADQKAWKKMVAKPTFEEYANKVEKMGYPDARKMLKRFAELLGYKPWEY